jgi:hypothetical protein
MMMVACDRRTCSSLLDRVPLFFFSSQILDFLRLDPTLNGQITPTPVHFDFTEKSLFSSLLQDGTHDPIDSPWK